MRYLETTVIAAHIAGDSEEKEAAAEAIADHSTVTSSFVREEFRSTFLREAVAAHLILTHAEDLKNAHRRIQEFFGERRKGRIGQWILDAVDSVFELAREGKLQDDPLQIVRSALRAKVEDEIMGQFDNLVAPDAVRDATHCQRAVEDPVFDDDLGTFSFSPRCSKGDPRPCAIAEFLKSHHEDLRALADGPDDLDDGKEEGQYRLRRCASRALKAPGKFRGLECTAGLSDAIIAMECPDEAALCSTDKHFGPICECLGKERIDARPPKKPKRRTRTRAN